MNCIGLPENEILPLLLSNLSSTELFVMVFIENNNNNVVYRSRKCKIFSAGSGKVCEDCQKLYNNISHFHHLYLDQSCQQYISKATENVATKSDSNDSIKEEKAGEEKTLDILDILNQGEKSEFYDELSDAKNQEPNVEVEFVDKDNKPSRNKSTNKTNSILKCCSECGEMVKSAIGLKRHVRKVHNKILNGPLVMKCPFCEETYEHSLAHSRSKILNHVQTYHFNEKDNQIYIDFMESLPKNKCKVCNLSFENYTDYKNHKADKHKYTIKPSENTLPCSICAKLFQNESSLKSHMKQHQDPKYVCSHCGKLFIRKEKLRQHITVTHEPDGGDCSVCHKTFSSKSYLVKHVKLAHVKDFHHKCGTCDKSFYSPNQLKNHINIVHMGIRPCACEHCEYKASSFFNLNLHRKKMHNIDLKFNKKSFISLLESGKHKFADESFIPLLKNIYH